MEVQKGGVELLSPILLLASGLGLSGEKSPVAQKRLLGIIWSGAEGNRAGGIGAPA